MLRILAVFHFSILFRVGKNGNGFKKWNCNLAREYKMMLIVAKMLAGVMLALRRG